VPWAPELEELPDDRDTPDEDDDPPQKKYRLEPEL
jgi:hypothetical protein